MKKINGTSILVLFTNLLFAQHPLVKQWDSRFGGTGIDGLTSMKQTADGGFVLCGYSWSGIGGDKTQASWGWADYWLVKTDALGNKQWDKDFGGTIEDFPRCVQQTADGGFILAGYSLSPIGGDKTQAGWGSFDYWIIKTDSLGNKQWDKDFGGSDDDKLMCIQQTADGGFILGGHSASGISGDKTQASWGSYDYWILKTDALGNKQWDKNFGGSDDDRLMSVQQTSDGGFVLGGWSRSGFGGDKTQASWGAYDYWIVKTDSLGNKLWDKDFGGSDDDQLNSVQQTNDGGFILGGFSSSSISGDKTENTWGGYDYWLVKTDSLGNKLWDKNFGGSADEYDIYNYAGNLQTAEGGYLISAPSYSPISGDKTESNLGTKQAWFVLTDSLGNKLWDKTLHTAPAAYDDEQSFAIQASEGCYLMATNTYSGIGGDKTQTSNGAYDFWIIKFCDTTTTTPVHEITNMNSIEIYPNPFIDKVSISIQKQNIKHATFTIKNVFGQTVFSQQENYRNSTYIKTMDLNFLSTGIYMMEIIVDGERTVKKVVKE